MQKLLKYSKTLISISGESEPKLNPFVSDALFLYLLKTSENLTVVRCFQGVEKGFIGNE